MTGTLGAEPTRAEHQLIAAPEGAAHEAEALLRLMTDHVPALLSYIDTEFRYRSANLAYETWFGISRESIRGRHVRDVLGDAAWEKLRPYMEAAARGERVTYEDRIPYAQGGARWIDATYVPDVDASGRVRGFAVLVNDGSSRKQAELALRESEERLRIAQQAARWGVFDYDYATGANYWSPEVEALYGLEPGEFDGTYEGWIRRIHPADRARAEAEMERAEESGDYNQDFRVVWPDGTVRWISTRAQVFMDADGRPLRLLGVNVDVTDRKRAEEALREAHRRKDEFLATLAHELRNPLAPLRSALEIVRHDGASSTAVARGHAIMDRQLAHLVRLVDDLLDVSRITTGKIELRAEPTTLDRVLDAALEATTVAIESRSHRVSISLPPDPVPLYGDVTRLAQVFANLLDNSAKYTDPGGDIRITAQLDGDTVDVKVTDAGIGISSDVLPHVFDIFTQDGRAVGRAPGGLGIGLSLVRRLVELHGGSVGADSPGPGGGTTMTVRLPLAGASITPLAAPATPVESSRCRVLVVDDNRDAADSLALLLSLEGHETRAVYHGSDALESARSLQPDVVLLDIGLPGMDGYEIARRVRADPMLRRAMLVATTGWGQEADKRKARAEGFDVHLTKPVDPQALLRMLESRPSGG